MSILPNPTADQIRATTTYGEWLADQDWNFAEDGEYAWVMDEGKRYLAEGVTEDSEGLLVSNEKMKQALHLMQYAPRMLRFMLRGLETIDNGALNDTTKVEHLKLLLQEVVGNALGDRGHWLDVARAVEHRQGSRG